MKYIDLSVLLNENTPAYPGDPKFTIKPAGILEKDGYEDHVITFGTHNGTHIDAPAHMIKNGKTLDKYPIEKFIGEGICINIGKNFSLEKVKNIQIQENNIVLFYTGMSDVYYTPEYYNNHPAMTPEISEYLVRKKIDMVGVDMCSPDNEPFPIHKILLSKDILIIENLTNLKELVGKKFKIYAFPLKFNIESSPARIIAEIAE